MIKSPAEATAPACGATTTLIDKTVTKITPAAKIFLNLSIDKLFIQVKYKIFNLDPCLLFKLRSW
ncbi:hypothetical protein A3D45_01985 [Candidatus Falkowbacteria bacterium RIFCSPHIGHO2_02_FULL_42_9]|uniref:Uncharacterized protein n=1 Tax=Candidatus Falkowbacteria bacterium RIFCSPHIGHO2_02_FULL_42_9 TaxID=1797986 RepID=A0A1F5S8F3_9BACT|nr:MAG: hypothetical protein A3D45_01985 [Candidatus Falkowbacteria bacterium RIFCSPHIGHO2_02_FULL_42_9]